MGPQEVHPLLRFQGGGGQFTKLAPYLVTVGRYDSSVIEPQTQIFYLTLSSNVRKSLPVHQYALSGIDIGPLVPAIDLSDRDLALCRTYREATLAEGVGEFLEPVLQHGRYPCQNHQIVREGHDDWLVVRRNAESVHGLINHRIEKMRGEGIALTCPRVVWVRVSRRISVVDPLYIRRITSTIGNGMPILAAALPIES